MNKYEKEVVQAELDAEKEVLKALEKNYENALMEVDAKIAQLLGRGDADMQHVVYQVEFQKAIRKQITAILDQLHNDEFLTVSEYLTACYNEGVMGELYVLQQQGIPLMFPIDQEQVVAALQHDTALSVDLYTHLGKNITVLKKQIAEEITRGISTGMMYNEITRNLKDYARISKNRAATIVRTEGHRIQVAAQRNVMQKASDAGADIVKIWNATLDGKTRPSHAKIDGEIRELDENFSNGMEYPSDPEGGAAEVINCRCRLGRKARWLLDEEQTKQLGNTDKMTDKQLEPIAKKLGITTEELRKYKDNIIPVKARNYDDFRRQYEKIWNHDDIKVGNAGKTLANAGNSSKITSGAIYGALNDVNDPAGIRRDEHAKTYYDSLRNSNKEQIVKAISSNTSLSEATVSKMYDHLFVNKYDLDKGHTRFDPDYDIAESIQRLREGKDIQEHDLILVQHEAIEHDLMNSGGLSYEEAHKIANEMYDYKKALYKWLDRNDG